MDQCTSDSGDIKVCAPLQLQSLNQAAWPYGPSCRRTPSVNEIVRGQPLKALPGKNPMQKGPQNATMYMQAKSVLPGTFSNRKSTLTLHLNTVCSELSYVAVTYSGLVSPPGSKNVANVPSVLVSGSGYTYKGCYSDQQWTRVLPNQLTVSGDMTVTKCLAACAKAGYKVVRLSACCFSYIAHSFASVDWNMQVSALELQRWALPPRNLIMGNAALSSVFSYCYILCKY